MRYFNKIAENTVAFDDPNKKRGSGKGTATVNGKTTKGNVTITGNMDDDTYNSIKNDAMNGGSSDPFASFDSEVNNTSEKPTISIKNDKTPFERNNPNASPTDNSIETNNNAANELSNTIDNEKKTNDSINTNNDAANDLANSIKMNTAEQDSTFVAKNMDNAQNKSIDLNNKAETNLNNTINNETKNVASLNNTATPDTSTVDEFGNGISEEPAPPPPTETSNNLNAEAKNNLDLTVDNAENNSSTDASKKLNNKAETTLNNEITNNTTTNNTTKTEPPAGNAPPANEPPKTSLDDLKSRFKTMQDNSGKTNTTSGPGPSDYQKSVGDKREHAKKPQM